MTHVFFIVVVLYRSTFNIVAFDSWVYTNLLDVLDVYYVPTAAYIVHLVAMQYIFILAQTTMLFVAAPNTRPHFLFPLQFFDYCFSAVFYSLRNLENTFSASFIGLQFVMQVWLFMRNSGIVSAYARSLLLKLTERFVTPTNDQLRKANYDYDPLLTIQYDAAVAIQYDFADMCAFLLTLLVILFFVWRDGFFTLQCTGLLVKATDNSLVIFRFAIILGLKLIAGYAARTYLMRTMRKTLLGQRTLHGVSQLAHEILASHSLVKGQNAAETANKHFEQHLSKSIANQEHVAEVRRELNLKNLDYHIFARRFLRRFGPFLLCCMAFCLFACFPVTRTLHHGNNATDWFSDNRTCGEGFTNKGAAAGTEVNLLNWLQWTYVKPSGRIHLDDQVREYHPNWQKWGAHEGWGGD